MVPFALGYLAYVVRERQGLAKISEFVFLLEVVLIYDPPPTPEFSVKRRKRLPF